MLKKWKRSKSETVGGVLVDAIRGYYPEIIKDPIYLDPCYNEICDIIRHYYLFGFGDTADDMYSWYVIKEELLPPLYKIVNQVTINKDNFH